MPRRFNAEEVAAHFGCSPRQIDRGALDIMNETITHSPGRFKAKLGAENPEDIDPVGRLMDEMRDRLLKKH